MFPKMLKGPAISSEDDIFVIGLEKNVKELVVQLTKEGDGSSRVVCIWGMGGIGKTTLAAQIYHHAEIRSHFAGSVWESVSDNTWTSAASWKGNRIFWKISDQLTKTIGEELDERQRKHAGAHLPGKLEALRNGGKTCLVILDDVWSDKGMFITRALLSGFLDIKILLTTRNKGLTWDLNASIFFHELRCLNKQQSWELFEKKVNFRRHVRDSEYNKMKELGEKILQRCGGLPLAITMLGKLLSKAQTTFEWKDIMLSKTVQINKREELTDILHILSSSYIDLPYYLTPCFLYLAHFPKDSKIRVKELCRIWRAESYLLLPRVMGSDTLEDKAYGFIDELVQRSMVQVDELDLHGRVKTLRIHNLMRQLCLVKARDHLGFVEIINSRNILDEDDAFFYDALVDVVPTYMPTRIAIYLNKDVAHELLPLIENACRQRFLQSLICFNRSPYPSYEKIMKPLLKRFRTLRVLKFENLTQGYVGDLPEEIGELLNLRFLSLRGSHVGQVPSSIGNLVSLQTLDLRTKWTLRLPNVLWKLEQLRHLYLGRRTFISGNELRLDNLKSLHTLVNIPLMSCNLNDLMELTQVRNLKFYVHAKWWKKIDPGSIVFDLLRSLAAENLSRARIDLTPFMSSCLKIEKLRLEGKIEKLPEDKYFPKLIKLTLNRSDLEDDPMTTLEKLPNLRYLLLNYNAFKGNAMVCSAGGFPRLESLSLVGLEQLKEWRVEKGALPSLSFLLIEYCHELEAIPDGLRCITNLKKMVIKRMPREFEMKVEEIGNDFYKVHHVLDIEFLDDELPYCYPSNSSEHNLSTFSPDLSTHPINYSRHYFPECSPKLETTDLNMKMVAGDDEWKERVATFDKTGAIQRKLAWSLRKDDMHIIRDEKRTKENYSLYWI